MKDVMNALHHSQRLSVAPGLSNPDINPDLEGIYVTAQIGLSTKTFFLGVRLSTGEQIAEWVSSG